MDQLGFNDICSIRNRGLEQNLAHIKKIIINLFKKSEKCGQTNAELLTLVIFALFSKLPQTYGT